MFTPTSDTATPPSNTLWNAICGNSGAKRDMPAEGLLGAARLARSLCSGPPSNTTAFNAAQVGLTEQTARKNYDVHTVVIRFDCVARMIIDGHKDGLCKLITDRKTQRILGCHVVGERAVDIVQIAAIVIAAGMELQDFLRIPISFPIYAGILFRAAAAAARELNGASHSETLLSAS